MALDKNGCTDCKELKNWYNFTLKNPQVQQELLKHSDRTKFSEELMELAAKNGFYFTREALDETFNDTNWSEEELIDIGFEDAWIIKIMIMGWAPTGYSR